MFEVKVILPTTLEQLTTALADSTDETCLLSGGTDLIIKMRNYPFRYNQIIDLSGVDALKKIQVHEETIEIGSMVTLCEIEKHPEIIKHFSALADAAGSVGSTQIRNRATFAGNIANASPCADTAAALMAYEAMLRILDSTGQIRWRSVDDVMIGMGKNRLNNNEAIIGCVLDLKKGQSLAAFRKLGSRKSVSISKLNLTVVLDITQDNQIAKSCVTVGSLGPKPFRVREIESFLNGKILSEDLKVPLSELLMSLVTEMIKNRASMPYKRMAIRGLTADVLDDILEKAKQKRGVI